MSSPTRWTCFWVNSGSWWWTGRPGELQSIGSQRVGHDWVTELNCPFYSIPVSWAWVSLLRTGSYLNPKTVSKGNINSKHTGFHLQLSDQIRRVFIHIHIYVLSHSVMSSSLQLHGLYPSRLLCPWGFSRQEYWSGLSCPPPGDLPNPRIELRSPPLQADSLRSDPLGKFLSPFISIQFGFLVFHC